MVPRGVEALREAASPLHSWHDGPLLGCAERSTPESPKGRAVARGVDGESACRAIMVMPWRVKGRRFSSASPKLVLVCYRLIDSPSCWRSGLIDLIQGGAPLTMRHSSHKLISGQARARTKIPHAPARAERGLQGGWDPSGRRRLSA